MRPISKASIDEELELPMDRVLLAVLEAIP
jgi:hypothetical protein